MPEPAPRRRGLFVTIKSKISVTGIKSIVGSIFKIDIGGVSLFALVGVAAVAVGATAMIGEAAGAWDVVDAEPTPIVITLDGQAPSILQEILAAALDDPELGDVTVIVPLEQFGAIVDAAIDRAVREILAAYVPPGPPVRAIVEENNCLLKSGRVCPDVPESVAE